MKAIAVFDGMPKNCKECCVRINIESSKAISFCALTGLLLKISELDVIDGMCPLRPYIKVDATVNDIGVSPMLYALVVNDFMKHLTGETE